MNNNRMKGGIVKIISVAGVMVLAACQSLSPEASRARADLQPTRGNQTTGVVSFTQTGDKVRVNAVVSGLSPNLQYGFHIHEVGDCSAADGSSAKDHFNPKNAQHGYYETPEHHAGDMPNLRADNDGRAHAVFELTGVTLKTGPTSVVGRGLIVHSQPDDYKSQPAGNAGPRIACAVIKAI